LKNYYYYYYLTTTFFLKVIVVAIILKKHNRIYKRKNAGMLLEAPQLPRVLIFNKGSTVSQSTVFASRTYLERNF